jgi:hypothetical protein
MRESKQLSLWGFVGGNRIFSRIFKKGKKQKNLEFGGDEFERAFVHLGDVQLMYT